MNKIYRLPAAADPPGGGFRRYFAPRLTANNITADE
jgi:hypothetical protein